MTDNLASLTAPADLQTGALPLLWFHVAQWDTDKDAIKGAELTLYECDYDDSSADGAATDKKLVAVVQFDLARNKAETPSVGWLVSSPPKLVKGKPGKDLVLYLGGEGKKRLALSLAVPRDADTFHDEGADFEIGWTFKAAGAEMTRTDRVATQTSTIPTRDPLEDMLGLRKSAKVGRFSDPDRNPSLAPDDAFQQLEGKTLPLLRAAGATADPPIDVDGLRFSNFVKKGRRRAVIEDLASNIRIAKADPVDASVEKFVKTAFKTTDIQLAYFVVHDLGTEEWKTKDGKPFLDGTYKPLGRNDRNSSEAFTLRPNRTPKSATGYINMNGSVVVCFDMSATVKSGTLGPWTTDRWAVLHTVGWESFPVCIGTDDDRDTSTDPKDPYDYSYVSMAWDPRTHVYVKWPTTIVETYADLYVLASARANHLVTITTHVEFGHAEHDDPRGLDLQILYDKITVKLNALSKREGGALQLPTGVRYGVNPRRSYDATQLADGKTRPRVIANPKSFKFPHQSGTWDKR